MCYTRWLLLLEFFFYFECSHWKKITHVKLHKYIIKSTTFYLQCNCTSTLITTNIHLPSGAISGNGGCWDRRLTVMVEKTSPQGISAYSILINARKNPLRTFWVLSRLLVQLFTEYLLYLNQNWSPIQRKAELRYGEKILTLGLERYPFFSIVILCRELRDPRTRKRMGANC
jgi:hypothetical protein